jgi:hypothetical protein
MMYVLIILTGISNYTSSSTAEFNSLAACEAAVVAIQMAEPDNGYVDFNVVGVCVPK